MRTRKLGPKTAERKRVVMVGRKMKRKVECQLLMREARRGGRGQ